MAIIKCPECGKEISNLADTCIHCGFPIKKYSEEDQSTSCCEFCGRSIEPGAMCCDYCGMETRTYKSIGTMVQRFKAAKSINRAKRLKAGVIGFFCIAGPFAVIGALLMWVWEIPQKNDRRIVLTILACMYAVVFYYCYV